MTHADLLLYAASLKVQRDALLEALREVAATLDAVDKMDVRDRAELAHHIARQALRTGGTVEATHV